MGAGGAGKGLRTTLVRWQQWEKIGVLPVQQPVYQANVLHRRNGKWLPFDQTTRGRSEFEQGRGTIGDRGRSRARTGKKTEVTEERADEPGGPLLIVVDARRMSGAMTKCENGGGADVGSDARPM